MTKKSNPWYAAYSYKGKTLYGAAALQCRLKSLDGISNVIAKAYATAYLKGYQDGLTYSHHQAIT